MYDFNLHILRYYVATYLWWDDSDFEDLEDDEGVDFDLLEEEVELLEECLWWDDEDEDDDVSVFGIVLKLPPPLIRRLMKLGSLCEIVTSFLLVNVFSRFNEFFLPAFISSKFGVRNKS